MYPHVKTKQSRTSELKSNLIEKLQAASNIYDNYKDTLRTTILKSTLIGKLSTTSSQLQTFTSTAYVYVSGQGKKKYHSLIRGVGSYTKLLRRSTKNSPNMYFVIHNSVVLFKILKIIVPFLSMDYYQNNQFYRVKN